MPTGDVTLISWAKVAKLTSVTREQAAASTARNRTNQKALKSWRSDGAAVMTDAEDINCFITTKLHRLTRVRKES